MNAVRRIEPDVLAILSAGVCEGVRYYLPQRQLPRKDYERVNNVLDALGGKWMRRAKAHVFADVCEPIIEGAIETGTFVRPADMGWFPTPRELVERVVEAADVSSRMHVLEPSAGEGAIAEYVDYLAAIVRCVEIDPKRAAILRQRFGDDNVIEADFLTEHPVAAYDAVVMNPPFAKRADIHHVLHARNFLKPGGRLAAIMSGGISFREDRLTREFRDVCDTIEQLPAGSFHASGTDVSTVLATMGAA